MYFLSHFATQKAACTCTCTCSFILRLSSPGVKYRIYMYMYMYMRGENLRMWLFLLYTCTNPTCIFQMISDINGPGAKVCVITREVRYYVKTRTFASCYAIFLRAHAACAVA